MNSDIDFLQRALAEIDEAHQAPDEAAAQQHYAQAGIYLDHFYGGSGARSVQPPVPQQMPQQR